MKKINNLGFDLQDNTKEVSVENKVTQFFLFNTCTCGHEIELTDRMFSDDCKCGTGWEYRCLCGKNNSVWEGAFDSKIESFYDNDLVVMDSEV